MSPRIGLVIYGSLTARSGGFLYDRMLVNALRKRGSSVEVFSLPWRLYPLHLLDNLLSDLSRRIQAARLDLLLEDELNHPSLVLLNRDIRRRTGCSIVSIVHHLRSSEHRPGWQNAGYAAIERAYLEGVDALVFNSQTTARSVRRLIGACKPSIVAYPSGDRFQARLDENAIRARARRVPPLRILFLGNVIARKGLHTLIDAVALLPREAWTLTVIGDLRLDPGLTRRIRQNVAVRGLAERIWFAGRLWDGDLAEVLGASHVLAIPSTYEGYGIAYLEGMGFGLPAIGTTLGGAREIITDRINGRLLRPNDPAALSQALMDLIGHPETLAAMSHAALQRALVQPSWTESMAAASVFIESMI
jgi:glycosyltransferase involved in cell wall biosynthesis